MKNCLSVLLLCLTAVPAHAGVDINGVTTRGEIDRVILRRNASDVVVDATVYLRHHFPDNVVHAVPYRCATPANCEALDFLCSEVVTDITGPGEAPGYTVTSTACPTIQSDNCYIVFQGWVDAGPNDGSEIWVDSPFLIPYSRCEH